MKAVRLFREASSSSRYEEALQAAGYAVSFQAPLIFRSVNAAALQAKLAHPTSFGGLIFTSARAAQALEAIDEISTLMAPWADKPCYTVGPATAEAARTWQLNAQGEEAGTAHYLGNLIAQTPSDLPLLFLCGERHRPELPAILEELGQPFEKQIVYESLPAEITVGKEAEPEWAVFFSPAGADIVLRNWPHHWRSVSLAAIGATTAAFLVQQGRHVSTIAANPTPLGLAKALTEADQVHA